MFKIVSDSCSHDFLDIDECTTNRHSCDVNAICQNTVGSYNCTCKPGFYGNGTKCLGNSEDIYCLFYGFKGGDP